MDCIYGIFVIYFSDIQLMLLNGSILSVGVPLFFQQFFWIFIAFVIVLWISRFFFRIPWKISENFWKNIFIFLVFWFLLACFLFFFFVKLFGSVSNLIIEFVLNVSRWDEKYWTYREYLEYVFRVAMPLLFGFLLYKIYRNIVENAITKRKIFVSIFFLFIATACIFVCAWVFWLVSVAWICGNSRSGEMAMVMNIWFFIAWISFVMMIFSILLHFFIWPTSHLFPKNRENILEKE